MKPQTSFVLPVMLYALYRRYLHRRGRPELIDGALSVGLVAAPSLALWAVSGLAFGLGPVSLLRFYQDAASVYPVTSANAFNLWGALGSWRNDSTGDHVMTIAGISALHFGMLLFAAGVALVLWRVHRAIERGAAEGRVLTVGAAVVGLLAFTLLTRMHERYMFVSLACLAVLAFARPLRLSYAALSGLFLLNLWYPYAFFNSQWGVQDFHLPAVVRLDLRRICERHVAANGLVARRHRGRPRHRVVRAPLGRAVARRRVVHRPATGLSPPRGLHGRLRRPRESSLVAEAAAALSPKRLARWAPIVARRPGLPVRSRRPAGARPGPCRTSTTAHFISRWCAGPISRSKRDASRSTDGSRTSRSARPSSITTRASRRRSPRSRRTRPAQAIRAPTSGSCTCSWRCGRSPSTWGRACWTGTGGRRPPRPQSRR